MRYCSDNILQTALKLNELAGILENDMVGCVFLEGNLAGTLILHMFGNIVNDEFENLVVFKIFYPMVRFFSFEVMSHRKFMFAT